jgi:hypothetical protein
LNDGDLAQSVERAQNFVLCFPRLQIEREMCAMGISSSATHTLRKRFGVVCVGLSLFFGDAAAISSP